MFDRLHRVCDGRAVAHGDGHRLVSACATSRAAAIRDIADVTARVTETRGDGQTITEQLDRRAAGLGSSHGVSALRDNGRLRADVRDCNGHRRRAVTPHHQRGRHARAAFAQPARPHRFPGRVRRHHDRALALEFNHTLQYVITRERGIIQARIVILIALLALARKVIVVDLYTVAPATVGALAGLALALSVTYWLIQDGEAPLGADPGGSGRASTS